MDEEDGIWFSKDGGSSFRKGWSYPDTPGERKQYLLNMDSLVHKAGLRYTDDFVLRFQQSDDRRFDGRGNMRGGVYLDDITVTYALETPVVIWPKDSTLLADCREYPVYWKKVDHSTAFRGQLYALQEEEEIIIKDTTLSSNQVIFTRLEEDSLYYFRVKALGEYTEGGWSDPVMFRTYPVFEATLQIAGEMQEDSTLVLEASPLPSHIYQWFRNGEKFVSTGEPVLEVMEPGSYSVFITNRNCGIMSPVLEVSAEALGIEEESGKSEPSAQSERLGPE